MKFFELINQAAFLRQISWTGFNLVIFCFHKWRWRKKYERPRLKKKERKKSRDTHFSVRGRRLLPRVSMETKQCTNFLMVGKQCLHLKMFFPSIMLLCKCIN